MAAPQGKRVVRTAAAVPKSQTKKKAGGNPAGSSSSKGITRAGRTRKQLIATGEHIPSLLDLKPDAMGCLFPNLVKPPKAKPGVWEKFAAHVRRRDVVYLRLHHGMSPYDIANYLGIPEEMARADWSDRLRTEVDGDVSTLRAMEVQRIDDWLAMLEPNIRKEIAEALSDPMQKGANYRALDKAIKLQTQRIRLLGLERPVRADEGEDPASLHLHKVDIHIDAAAQTADFIAGVLAAGAAEPEVILSTLQQAIEEGPSTYQLTGEALEDFLDAAESEVELIDVDSEEVLAEVVALEEEDDAPTPPDSPAIADEGEEQ